MGGLLQSWWEVLFVLAFVFVSGLSYVNPFWEHWFNPIIIVMVAIVAVAMAARNTRK
ncbi:MAG TPA: hypothetical protein VNJ52_00930 [Patescibacteria group bacterium]|nr:hypothetical protein [Patescibacteria group bacterium]